MSQQPSYLEPDPQLRAQLEKFREQHAGDPIGDVATRALFEDERVKIWEMRLEPGQATALHHHARDYYLVILQGDRIAGLPPKGSDDPIIVADLPPGGTTVSVPRGGTEWAINIGKQTYYEILVELKK
jgi:hypothetical protein